MDKLQINHVNLGTGNDTELFLARWAAIDASSAGDNTIIAAVPGKKIRVIGIKFSCAADVGLKWQSHTTDLGPVESYATDGGMSDYWGPHGCFFETAVGEALILDLDGAVQVSGWISYLLV